MWFGTMSPGRRPALRNLGRIAPDLRNRRPNSNPITDSCDSGCCVARATFFQSRRTHDRRRPAYPMSRIFKTRFERSDARLTAGTAAEGFWGARLCFRKKILRPPGGRHSEEGPPKPARPPSQHVGLRGLGPRLPCETRPLLDKI
jgi:hypothetical protein